MNRNGWLRRHARVASRMVFVLSLVGAAAGASALTAGVSAAASHVRNVSRASSAPVRGGTLYMVGTGDVTTLDPNIAFGVVTNLAMRLYVQPLLAYEAVPGKTTTLVPDLAAGFPVASAGDQRFTFTIRKGIRWDTNPPRQVTGADILRGLELSCNPYKPSSALSEYETVIEGLGSFCNGFEKVKPTLTAMKQFMLTHRVPGVTLDPSNNREITFTLTHRAAYFPDIVAAFGAFYGAPSDYLTYLPGSSAFDGHVASDGPYRIESYVAGKSIVFDRNPVWKAALDPISKAYVDRVVVDETVPATSAFEELKSGTSHADMLWGVTEVPSEDISSLLASHTTNFLLGNTGALTPFLVFNFADPNDGGALKKVDVRRAIEYALDRSALVRIAGGPQVAPPVTQALPLLLLETMGFKDFNLYPYNLAKAKRILAPLHLTLKILYISNYSSWTKIFQAIDYELSKVGVKVDGIPVPLDTEFPHYLAVPGNARRGVWDLAMFGLVPTWYGNDYGWSWMFSLFDTASEAPNGENVGLFSNRTFDRLIAAAQSSPSVAEANRLAYEADRLAMKEAAIYPIASPGFAVYHASRVHNAVFMPSFEEFDPTNVWLSQ